MRNANTVGFWEKIALGTGTLPAVMGWNMVKTLTVSVYQMMLGVNPVLLGAAMSIPHLWDAFTDPMMGHISDNFHSRIGRRRPFIMAGAVLTGLAFGGLWMVPESWNDHAKVAYLVVALLVYYTCFTIFMVPLQSLQLEMTPDYDERTRIAGYSSFFAKIADFSSPWIFPLSQLAVFGTGLLGIRIVGWGACVFVFMIPGLIPGLFVKERYYKKAEKQNKVRFLDAVRTVFNNRGFLILISMTILLVISGMFSGNLMYYLLVYFMNDGSIAKGAVWFGILSSSYAGFGLASLWPIIWLAGKFGKKAALATIFGMVTIGGILKWFFFQPGHTWIICLDAFFCAPIWTAISVLKPAMLADICDDDELKTGKRQEGMFGSLFTWVHKLGVSLAFLGTGCVLQIAGFDSKLGGNQSEMTFTIMRVILSIAPALTSALTVVILMFYPISRRRAEEIRIALEERRGKVS